MRRSIIRLVSATATACVLSLSFAYNDFIKASDEFQDDVQAVEVEEEEEEADWVDLLFETEFAEEDSVEDSEEVVSEELFDDFDEDISDESVSESASSESSDDDESASIEEFEFVLDDDEEEIDDEDEVDLTYVFDEIDAEDESGEETAIVVVEEQPREEVVDAGWEAEDASEPLEEEDAEEAVDDALIVDVSEGDEDDEEITTIIVDESNDADETILVDETSDAVAIASEETDSEESELVDVEENETNESEERFVEVVEEESVEVVANETTEIVGSDVGVSVSGVATSPVEENVDENDEEENVGENDSLVEAVDSTWRSIDENASSESTQADANDSKEALDDQVWYVTTNGSGYFCQVLENGAWRTTTVEEFHAGDDPDRVTIIWAHGFQTLFICARR